MASLAATNWHKPLCVVPCLSWSTASNVFTNGVMAQSINWDVLETQYFSDGNYRERLSSMVTIVDDSFLAGQRFAAHFNKSINKLKDDIQNVEINQDHGNQVVVDTMDISRTNSLNLSPALLEKLLSKEKCSLTKQEINELNEKIREAQIKWGPKSKSVDDPLDALHVLRLANGVVVDKPQDSSLASLIVGSTTKLMNYILPKKPAPASTDADTATGSSKEEWWERSALQFMRGVMDECTHLKNFSVPIVRNYLNNFNSNYFNIYCSSFISNFRTLS